MAFEILYLESVEKLFALFINIDNQSKYYKIGVGLIFIGDIVLSVLCIYRLGLDLASI